GDLDPSFDGDGMVTTTVGGAHAARSVALQPDGKIVAAGEGFNGIDRDFALARYNPDGALDTTFDGDGKLTRSVGPDYDEARSLALQPDGKIVAAGVAGNGADLDFALLRFRPDGALDTGFSRDGIVTTGFGAGHDVARSVALQPDGKIVAAGYSAAGAPRDFALARYHPGGALDTGFSGDGRVTVNIGDDDVAWGVVVQPGRKLVISGESHLGGVSRFALVRIFGV
ncbi:MAG: delta-60 repeat domain-containing protein, partial [Actinomycetota bacterium]